MRGLGTKRGGGFGPRLAQDGCTIVQGAYRDLVAGLENDELLASDQSEHRVGIGLGVLDEVAIDGERAAVQACQYDHVGVPPRSVIGEKGVVNRNGQQMDGEDREMVCRGKVGGASADEVRE